VRRFNPYNPVFLIVLSALVVAGFAGGFGVMLGILRGDAEGPFGESQAAWFQAILSAAAIWAAIWIDQGAARRLREDRAQAARDARAARQAAVINAAVAVEDVIRLIERWEPEERQSLIFRSPQRQGMEVARDVLRFYLRQETVELDERLVAALTSAEWRISEAIGSLSAASGVYPLGGAYRDGKIAQLRDLANAIRAAL